MSISIFDLFSIGIGPSSSHTLGPMRAGNEFIAEHLALLPETTRVTIDLYGSLALTGRGHLTDVACLLGLQSYFPESVDPEQVSFIIQEIYERGAISLHQAHQVPFNKETDLIFHMTENLPGHPNGLRFSLYQDTQCIAAQAYYSIGGGFIVKADQFDGETLDEPGVEVPYPFENAKTLMQYCEDKQCRIADIMFENERVWREDADIRRGVLMIWQTMHESIGRGCARDGILPGGLKVKRRARALYQKLQSQDRDARLPLDPLNWVNLYALAVNEENAAGGRIVTAPTNGAAGVLPAVLQYYLRFVPGANENGILAFLLTAAAIAILYKKGASISAAEVGCQGEIGVACSMAAGALCAVMGGTIYQVENAAEIGMEHNLGLTCDPIAGLVQIPCIERNTMGAVKAINAAKLALMGDGQHTVALDTVIQTMLQTGRDMQDRYKETSQGGLAINHPNC